MNYRDLIKKALWITLRNRFLWFLGFFISGGIGSSNFNSSTGGPGNSNGGPGDASPAWPLGAHPVDKYEASPL